jgi:hypothetical protein
VLEVVQILLHAAAIDRVPSRIYAANLAVYDAIVSTTSDYKEEKSPSRL